jgi:phage head maturation protease
MTGDVIGFRADVERRTVGGLLVPWNTVARASGSLWIFEPGSLHWAAVSRVKLNVGHERMDTIGVATRLVNTARGLEGAFKVARVPEGDQALQMAVERVLDGFSIEVDFAEGDRFVDTGQERAGQKVRRVSRAHLVAVALTPHPAFDDARVTHVAASRPASGKVRLRMRRPSPALAATRSAPGRDVATDPTLLAGLVAAATNESVAKARVDPADWPTTHWGSMDEHRAALYPMSLAAVSDEVEAAAAREVEAAESARRSAQWRDEWHQTTATARQTLGARFEAERADAALAARRRQYRADFPPLSQTERRRPWMSRALSRARTFLSGT